MLIKISKKSQAPEHWHGRQTQGPRGQKWTIALERETFSSLDLRIEKSQHFFFFFLGNVAREGI